MCMGTGSGLVRGFVQKKATGSILKTVCFSRHAVNRPRNWHFTSKFIGFREADFEWVKLGQNCRLKVEHKRLSGCQGQPLSKFFSRGKERKLPFWSRSLAKLKLTWYDIGSSGSFIFNWDVLYFKTCKSHRMAIVLVTFFKHRSNIYMSMMRIDGGLNKGPRPWKAVDTKTVSYEVDYKGTK